MAEPIRSMTGFGSGSCKQQDYHVSVEVRSVNHRYLKVGSRVPEEHSWLQERVESLVREVFGRGTINVTVQIDQPSQASSFEIDADLLRKLHSELSGLAAELAPGAPLGIQDLLGLDGVVRPVLSGEKDDQRVLGAVETALGVAFEKIQEMQLREGRHLCDELVRILDAIEGGLEQVEALQPKATDENGDRYHRRLQEFLEASGVEVNPSDLLREVAILAEKADITEETGRLQGHLQQYREAITEGGRVGRKLDFLAQEMLREANTMAAKTNHFDLARLVVELKTEIDRLREQTQNIE